MNLGLLGKPRHRPLAQERRLVDLVVSQSARSYTTNNTWETIADTSISWVSTEVESYRLEGYLHWKQNSGDARVHIVRALLDGSLSLVTPSDYLVLGNEGSSWNTNAYVGEFVVFDLLDVPPGPHTVYLQTHDGGGNLDRGFFLTQLILLRHI